MKPRNLSIRALPLLLQLAAAEAVAQPAPPVAGAQKEAVALADRGWELYSAGRYDEALTAFREAEAKVHVPPFLLMTARSYVKLGRLVEARSAYQRVAREDLSPNAPRGFAQARSDAQAELADLEPRIPYVEIVTISEVPRAMDLALDGTAVQPSTPVPCDPGEHTVNASRRGYLPLRITFQLIEGARRQIVIDQNLLKPLPSVAEPARSMKENNVGPDKRLMYTGLAVTGVATGLGAVFGILSLKRADAADEKHAVLEKAGGRYACSGGQRGPDCNTLMGLREDAATFTKVSWISFGGAVVAGAGTLIYYWTTTTPQARGTAQVQATPLAAMDGGGVVVTGTW